MLGSNYKTPRMLFVVTHFLLFFRLLVKMDGMSDVVSFMFNSTVVLLCASNGFGLIRMIRMQQYCSQEQ